MLIEKPMGRDAGEALALMAAAQRPGQLRVGLNYRFFDGVEALLADVRAGNFGELISLDVVLGHGGSPGDERSWKLDPVRAGGGCLIDPGIHVLDLLLQIAGPEVEVVGARTWSGFWNTGIEEEAHLLFAGPVLPLRTCSYRLCVGRARLGWSSVVQLATVWSKGVAARMECSRIVGVSGGAGAALRPNRSRKSFVVRQMATVFSSGNTRLCSAGPLRPQRRSEHRMKHWRPSGLSRRAVPLLVLQRYGRRR